MKLNVVPARTGILWFKLGVQTFLRQPLALAGLFFMYMAAVLLLSGVPVIGVVVGAMLVPAATLGLMAATAEAAKGNFPMPSILVSAFRAGRQRAHAMLLLGAIYTTGSVLATALGGLLAGDAALVATPPAAPATMPPAAPASGAAVPPPPQLELATLVSLLLHAPLFLLFWHAPALVHWHGISPAKSLFFSAVACLRNFGALAVYSLAWMGFFLAVSFAVGFLALLTGSATLSNTLMVPLALLMAAMFTTSMYFTFRDSFVAQADESADLPPPPTSES